MYRENQNTPILTQNPNPNFNEDAIHLSMIWRLSKTLEISTTV